MKDLNKKTFGGSVYCVYLPPKGSLILPDRPVQPDWNSLEQERWRTLNDTTQAPLGVPTGWLAICSFILFFIS